MYTTAEAAELVGVSKNTLLRWISEGRLRDVQRDWRNWRVWSEADIARARELRDRLHERVGVVDGTAKAMAIAAYSADMTRLAEGRAYRAG